MVAASPIITILTDFGAQDGYVATMKGVMLSIAPAVRLIDITHQITPQDIRQASSVLAEVYQFYPPHTVHLVVVDPGVGGERKPIAVQTPRGLFVAPDNGVLTHALHAESSWKAVRLDNPDYWLAKAPSNTFHGRDIFCPVAAHLASGVPLEKLGTPVDSLTHLNVASVTINASMIKGEVDRIDHFGNVITNIKGLRWAGDGLLELQTTDQAPLQINANKAQVVVGWHTIDGIHPMYSAVTPSHRLAVIGSGGELEIAINQGSAAEKMNIKVGDPVSIRLSS